MFDDVIRLLGVVLWPAIVLGFLLYFRKPISNIIGSIGRSIEKAERGSLGVGSFNLDWGKAEEELVEAAQKTEQRSKVRSTGDGGILDRAIDTGRDVVGRMGGDEDASLDDLLDGEEEAGEESESAGIGSGAGTGTGYGQNVESTRRRRAAQAAADEWQPVRITRSQRESAIQRAQRAADKLSGLRILWVDEDPAGLEQERRMFRMMNVDVTAVVENEEALQELRRGEFDIVISDMRRGDDDRAGASLLNEMRSQGFPQPVIFYIGSLDPAMGVPPFAFGITNRPDELLHYVIEIAERRT